MNDVEAYQSDGADVLNSPGSVVRGNKLSHNSWNGLVADRVAGQPDRRQRVRRQREQRHRGQRRVRLRLGHRQQRGRQQGLRHRGRRRAGTSASSATARRATTPGLFFFDLHDSLIAKNSGDGQPDGIELSGGQFGSHGNRLTGNTANRERRVPGSSSTRTSREPRAGNTLKGNTANKNQGHGIEATGRCRSTAAGIAPAAMRRRRSAWTSSARAEARLRGVGRRRARLTPPDSSRVISSAFSSARRRPSVRRRGSAPSSRRAQGQFFRTSGSERPADRQVAPALADAQSVAHALEVASFCVYAAP